MAEMITAAVGKNSKNPGMLIPNRPDDVWKVQKLLNLSHQKQMVPARRIAEDRVIGPETVGAISEFQQRMFGWQDGVVEPNGKTLQKLNEFAGGVVAPAPTGPVPVWVTVARAEVGQKEKAGVDQNNPRVLEYIRTFPYLNDIEWKNTGKMMGDVDETPWCACFVNWCLLQAGKAAGPNARAKDWLNYGTKLESPQVGAIAVVYHTPGASTAGTTSSGYHVAFWTGGSGNSVTLLGGNQSNAVSEKTYHGYWTVKGYRWPN